MSLEILPCVGTISPSFPDCVSTTPGRHAGSDHGLPMRYYAQPSDPPCSAVKGISVTRSAAIASESEIFVFSLQRFAAAMRMFFQSRL